MARATSSSTTKAVLFLAFSFMDDTLQDVDLLTLSGDVISPFHLLMIADDLRLLIGREFDIGVVDPGFMLGNLLEEGADGFA